MVDWMFEVMHKDPVDYGYKCVDLRLSVPSFVKAAFSSFIPTGLGNRHFRAPTLERLERVSIIYFMLQSTKYGRQMVTIK